MLEPVVEGDVDSDCDGETSGMKVRPQPRKPSAQEVENHMVDHYPWRSWCRYCVQSSSRGDHHQRQDEDQNDIPVISFDYAFFTDGHSRDHEVNDENAAKLGATPLLVTKDKRSEVLSADVVRCKGAEDASAIDHAVKHVQRLGYPEVIFRSDGEPAIKSFLKAVTEKLTQQGVRVIPNRSPLADSSSATQAEGSVRLIKERHGVLSATPESFTKS